jgi:hypothetical protein
MNCGLSFVEARRKVSSAFREVVESSEEKSAEQCWTEKYNFRVLGFVCVPACIVAIIYAESLAGIGIVEGADAYVLGVAVVRRAIQVQHELDGTRSDLGATPAASAELEG